MKLQKQIAYRYKGETRYKHVIVIPNETVKELGLKAGEELENSVDGEILILKPKRREG